jgi:hypothetical protein
MDIGPAQARFTEVIGSIDVLEAGLGQPNERVAAKVIDMLDIHCRRWPRPGSRTRS